MMFRSCHRIHRRRALTSIAVIVCLIVITLIGAALLKVGLAQRALAAVDERRLQAEWLAESGLDRALARLSADANYTGEEWPVRAEDLSLSPDSIAVHPGGSAAGPAALITISVDRPKGSANRRRIRVQADYPLDPSKRSRHTKEVLIDPEPDKAGVAP
jgi:hypothetical protein